MARQFKQLLLLSTCLTGIVCNNNVYASAASGTRVLANGSEAFLNLLLKSPAKGAPAKGVSGHAAMLDVVA